MTTSILLYVACIRFYKGSLKHDIIMVNIFFFLGYFYISTSVKLHMWIYPVIFCQHCYCLQITDSCFDIYDCISSSECHWILISSTHIIMIQMLAESTNSSLNGCVSSQQWTKTETETFTFLEINNHEMIKQNIKNVFISFNFQGNICHFNLVELDH